MAERQKNERRNAIIGLDFSFFSPRSKLCWQSTAERRCVCGMDTVPDEWRGHSQKETGGTVLRTAQRWHTQNFSLITLHQFTLTAMPLWTDLATWDHLLSNIGRFYRPVGLLLLYAPILCDISLCFFWNYENTQKKQIYTALQKNTNIFTFLSPQPLILFAL